ncbi:MAG: hypothetical protein DLM66_03780 [Candidatus Dormiibacter spiritus]|nr:MAG: hypothetical protein DLM66_03780 [Candidatus Dormibacteraeota bacterium]
MRPEAEVRPEAADSREPSHPFGSVPATCDRANGLEATIEVWQPLSPVPLTEEDARQILHNMTGFFNLLISWEAAAAAQSQPDEGLEAAA